MKWLWDLSENGKNLTVVCQSKKYMYKKDLRGREMRIAITQNTNNTVDIEMKASDSYIPVFRQISTENVAYGDMENQYSSSLYEIVVPYNTTQLAHMLMH